MTKKKTNQSSPKGSAKVIKYKVQVLNPDGVWCDQKNNPTFTTLNGAYHYADTWSSETRVVEVDDE